ncbi:Gfo/Idh/MocA family protein [Geodermatophilus sp. URMC 63]
MRQITPSPSHRSDLGIHLITPRPAAHPEPRAASGRVRVAVVGYGYWGSKHVRVLSSVPGVDVTVVDGHPLRLVEAAAHHPSAGMAPRLDDVLSEVDAVVVATPPGSHAGIALRALETGKHVLVEKPLATSVEDAELLVQTAARQGVQLMVGHTFEYNAAVWKLRELVQSGALGRILYVDTARLSLGRYQSDVNVIWDLAPHDISIVSYVLGEMPSCATVWAHSHISRQHADVAYLRFDFPRSQTRAYVHVSWLTPNKVRRVTVVGEKKMAVYDDMSDNERIRIYDIGVDVQDIDDPAEAHALPVTYRTGDIVSPYIPFQEPLLLQDQHFVECIRTGRRPDTPGERGLEVVRVLASTDRLADVTVGGGVPVSAEAATPGALGIPPQVARRPLPSPR